AARAGVERVLRLGSVAERTDDVSEPCRLVHLEPAEENAAALQHFIPEPVAFGDHESTEVRQRSWSIRFHDSRQIPAGGRAAQFRGFEISPEGHTSPVVGVNSMSCS